MLFTMKFDENLCNTGLRKSISKNKPIFLSFQSVIRNEIFYTSYSYPFFHLSMALGTMFITTQLTRWFAPIVSTVQGVQYGLGGF